MWAVRYTHTLAGCTYIHTPEVDARHEEEKNVLFDQFFIFSLIKKTNKNKLIIIIIKFFFYVSG